MLKKALLIFYILFITISSVFPSFTIAIGPDEPGPWYAPNGDQFKSKVFGAPESEIFGERYTHAQVYWIIYSLESLFFGGGVQEAASGANGDFERFLEIYAPEANPDNQDGQVFVPTIIDSPILGLASLIDSATYTPPASGINYIANKLERIDLVDNAYAQEGFGYGSLQPVQGLWESSRNAAYALCILVLIVLAFMIMFRYKISPQMVVTVQTAIPKLVIGLVLITFSYAIAGLIIDLAYLLLGVLSGVVHFSGVLDLNLRQAGPIDTFNAFNGVVHGVFSLMLLLFMNLLLVGVAAIIGGAALIPATGGLAAIGTPILVFAGILGLIILVVALYALVKLFWVLLKNYMILLILVIAGPFFILGGIVYSESLNFSKWIKLIVAQLSIFIVTALLIFFAHYLTWSTSSRLSPIQDWMIVNPFGIETATFGGVTQLPGFQGIEAGFVGTFAGLFIILTIPALASNISKMIMGGRADMKPSLLGAIPFAGAALGVGAATAQKGAGGYVSSAFGAKYGTRVQGILDRRLGVQRGGTGQLTDTRAADGT